MRRSRELHIRDRDHLELVVTARGPERHDVPYPLAKERTCERGDERNATVGDVCLIDTDDLVRPLPSRVRADRQRRPEARLSLRPGALRRLHLLGTSETIVELRESRRRDRQIAWSVGVVRAELEASAVSPEKSKLLTQKGQTPRRDVVGDAARERRAGRDDEGSVGSVVLGEGFAHGA